MLSVRREGKCAIRTGRGDADAKEKGLEPYDSRPFRLFYNQDEIQ
jgi:hypothetical protein